MLKCLSIPSIFPWNKSSVVVTKIISPAVSKPPSPSILEKVEQKIKDEFRDEPIVKIEPMGKPLDAPEAGSATKANGTAKKRTPFRPILGKAPAKAKKSSKRLSTKSTDSASSAKRPSATPERVKAATSSNGTPKKKNQVLNFLPGSSIEAQNFDGKWMPVKVIEVDLDEREVLVRSCDKNNKSKTG